MEIEKQIEIVKELNENIKQTRLKIVKTEEEIKTKEADLWLNSDWVELLNKDRPTEKDKTFFITLNRDLVLAKRRLGKYKAELDSFKKEYEIEILILEYLMER